jgi:hypothetical protein
MYDNGVAFYDPKRSIKKPEISQQALHKRRQANIREARFVLSILRQTRGPLSSL